MLSGHEQGSKTEVGIYKRKILRKKIKKNTLSTKKIIGLKIKDLDQEKKKNSKFKD